MGGEATADNEPHKTTRRWSMVYADDAINRVAICNQIDKDDGGGGAGGRQIRFHRVKGERQNQPILFHRHVQAKSS